MSLGDLGVSLILFFFIALFQSIFYTPLNTVEAGIYMLLIMNFIKE